MDTVTLPRTADELDPELRRELALGLAGPHDTHGLAALTAADHGLLAVCVCGALGWGDTEAAARLDLAGHSS